MTGRPKGLFFRVLVMLFIDLSMLHGCVQFVKIHQPLNLSASFSMYNFLKK